MENYTWREGRATFCLLVTGATEEFASFVKNQLSGDYYNSLAGIRESFLAEKRFEDVEFCLCVIAEEVLYALVVGGASLVLVRGGARTSLLKTLKSTASVVTGYVEPGDAFELETSAGKRLFTAQEPMAEQVAIKQRAARVIDRLLEHLPERRIIIHGGEGNTRARKASLVGIILLVVLGISVYFGVQRRADTLRREEYSPKLSEARHDFEEARELSGISSSRARELILRAHQTTKELKSQGVEDEELNSLASEISGFLGPIAGIYEEPANVFFDLSIVAAGFEGVDVALSGGELRILDAAGRRLVGMEVESKSTNVIAGPDYLPDALATAAYESRSFILSTDGVREVTGDVELVVKPDWSASDVLIAAFAGNLYVLDRGNNQIWRYPGVSSGFLEKEEWLGEGFTIDVSEAVAMAIDGSIWTVDKSGDFKVYSMGAPATFAINGNSQPFSEVVDLFASEESKFIYVLDRGNSRIAVSKKNGDYIGDYVAPELSAATSLVVSEEDGLILFLADSKLYSLEAKHLESTSDEGN
ncbi:hypothetical protein A2803_01440 [Candidatus Woesebacteria bacterium RIFCSPHIGHO2_01_FULL_44_21]|uniref:Uncharacterized protein n=1 Tax=Candidatus Woesebacteria bacterium RIFCSPHIGHO2_01_FULL_44_21 TaxID=1802503 RepID=A0A1F7Z0S2_9BACT|nr:MAG: hypothetical protein A2803_01440 [Candidatus Woesebacteria bacterium RIFCSPHIGHO2_01_FULL_44_21]OGM70848.1 MAG: hypothetical protein A2897_05430 [Candidatus Woesebacteria bacterium RIFCSPLOWO2_01_FULL_44_24b]